ncbi:MAG: class F sortase [Chloroflexi bacterium]|nr:class F sortase [Chloroflexota bacterium]MCH8160388.1 class F sortase [Chloroflexota bacterium]
MAGQTSSGWNRLSLAAMGAGITALAAAGVLFLLSITGIVGEDVYEGPPPAFDIEPTPRVLVERERPTATASPPPPNESPIASLSIPRFAVEAAIVVLGVDDDGVMETPDGPLNVAWYDFSARPGFAPDAEGGNAVFSGHVDYYNYGPAVFWHLKDLERDDVIEVRLADGTVYKYGVSERRTVNAGTAPIQEIVGDTLEEVITLITCGGTFRQDVGEYDQRVIVRATRIPDAPAEAQPAP